MELIGAMSEREWGTLSGMYTTEEADFMAQLLDNSSVPDDSSFGVHSSFWASHGSTMEMEGVDDGLMYCSDNNTNANIHSFSQESSYSGGSSSILFPSSNQPSYYLTDFHQFLETNNSSMSISYDMVEDRNTNSNVQVITNNLMEESSGCLKKSGWNLPEADLKMEPERPVPESSAGNNTNTSDKNSKKRPRISGDAQKNKRNARSKNNQKVVSTEEDSNMVLHGQSSSSCCSEDDSNASHELNGGVNSDLSRKGATALNSTGKARASRGTATDPQSLYARKRRERINERLRILQNLVPNGTKVDISTMLEEAVQYVKFLQLQIKLLSSDDMWMYAPIAYNGMDIGLDLKINSSR